MPAIRPQSPRVEARILRLLDLLAQQEKSRVETRERVIAIGIELQTLKKALSHGQWLPLLAGRLHRSPDWGQLYMRVAVNPERVQHLHEAHLEQTVWGIMRDLGELMAAEANGEGAYGCTGGRGCRVRELVLDARHRPFFADPPTDGVHTGRVYIANVTKLADALEHHIRVLRKRRSQLREFQGLLRPETRARQELDAALALVVRATQKYRYAVGAEGGASRPGAVWAGRGLGGVRRGGSSALRRPVEPADVPIGQYYARQGQEHECGEGTHGQLPRCGADWP